MDLIEYSSDHINDLSAILVSNHRQSAGAYAPEMIETKFKNRETWLAYDGKEFVGTASLANFGTQHEPVYFLSMVFVKPEKQRQGIGRLLVGKIEDRAREEGCGLLKVPAGSESEGFYLKLGYNYVEGVRKFDKDGHIIMSKQLV